MGIHVRVLLKAHGPLVFNNISLTFRTIVIGLSLSGSITYAPPNPSHLSYQMVDNSQNHEAIRLEEYTKSIDQLTATLDVQT